MKSYHFFFFFVFLILFYFYFQRNFGNFEIPRDLIKVAQKLGTGSFGTVYGGVYTHDENGEVPCAIKEAKNDALREQLLDEAYLMR